MWSQKYSPVLNSNSYLSGCQEEKLSLDKGVIGEVRDEGYSTGAHIIPFRRQSKEISGADEAL